MNSRQFDLHTYIFKEKENMQLIKSLVDINLNSEEQKGIRHAVQDLPEPIRSVVDAYYFSNKKTKAILEELGMGRVKFYNCLHKGKYLLRERLNAGYYDRAKEILYGIESFPR